MSEPAPPAHGEPLLRCERLERIYPDGEVHALRGVSLAVWPGECAAITGPSGCGKSTLLHLLGGLDRPTRGEVFFQETPLAAVDLDDYRARKLGFIFQSFHLLPTLTAIENIQVPMFEAPIAPRDRLNRARRLLEEVGLAPRANHLPSRLSVGERQRVAIARALANDPILLLADEPTGNLDSQTQQEVLDLLARLRRERGLTLVLVTHSAEVAATADHKVRLRDGTVVADERPLREAPQARDWPDV